MDLPLVKARRTYIVLTVFGIAMAVLEAIVVVYLRQLYYPKGFDFPLGMISRQMLFFEWIREAATIVMLAAVGTLAGRGALQRLCYYLYCFGVWDIFYYIWLKILLQWPPSLLTWDVLFLIPVTWAGPVLAPIIAALTMILISISIVYLQERAYDVKIKWHEWTLVFTGAGVILYTFIVDYSRLILREHSANVQSFWEDEGLWRIITGYKPTHYNWVVFVIGEILILTALALVIRRIVQRKRT